MILVVDRQVACPYCTVQTFVVLSMNISTRNYAIVGPILLCYTKMLGYPARQCKITPWLQSTFLLGKVYLLFILNIYNASDIG